MHIKYLFEFPAEGRIRISYYPITHFVKLCFKSRNINLFKFSNLFPERSKESTDALTKAVRSTEVNPL